MVFSYCKCSYHLAGNENAAANFYNTHFVPDGWELVYSKLSECRSIHLKGRCKDCYGDLNEMIPLPEGLSGDALFQAIYDAMWSAHPYDAILEHIGCHGPCEERSAFYRRRNRDVLSRRRENARRFYPAGIRRLSSGATRSFWSCSMTTTGRRPGSGWKRLFRRKSTPRFCEIPAGACSAA